MDTGDTGDEDGGDPRAPRPSPRSPVVLLRALLPGPLGIAAVIDRAAH